MKLTIFILFFFIACLIPSIPKISIIIIIIHSSNLWSATANYLLIWIHNDWLILLFFDGTFYAATAITADITISIIIIIIFIIVAQLLPAQGVVLLVIVSNVVIAAAID